LQGKTLVSWVDIWGNPASPPDFGALPDPLEVLASRAKPDFEALRIRNKDTFQVGLLSSFFSTWKKLFAGLPEFGVVESWLRDGVHLPFFSFSIMRAILTARF
jgi:hypothetical protein